MMIHFDFNTTEEFNLNRSNYLTHPLDACGLLMMGLAEQLSSGQNVYRTELIRCLFNESLGARMPIKSIHQMEDFD